MQLHGALSDIFLNAVDQALRRLCRHRCVKYYMYFKRAMALLKEVLLEQGHTTNARNAPGVPLMPSTAKGTCKTN